MPITAPEANKMKNTEQEHCRSCGSSDLRNGKMREEGKAMPVKICNGCGDWW